MLRDNNRPKRSSSSMPPTASAFSKRRHSSITLRGPSQEGQVELQETVRLRTKRRRGSHSTEEESVGNDQDYCDLLDGDVSRLSNRRTFTPLRQSKITDEIIGVTVPRKTRSASMKRAHDDYTLLTAEAPSPSSSNDSLRKKMKSIGPNTSASKSSSSTHEDIEIEIAQLLYGLKTSKNHDFSSQKLEPSDTDAEKKKKEDYGSSILTANNSAANLVRFESEQPAKVDKLPHGWAKISASHEDSASGREVGSSECPKVDNDRDNLNIGARNVVTEDGRSPPSCSKSKLDVDKQDFATTILMSDVPGVNSQRGDKFEIDLMAPPLMTQSPERHNLARGEDRAKVKDKVEKLILKEKSQEETQEVKTDWDVLKLDLERPSKHNDPATSGKLEEQDSNKEQPDESRSTPLSTAVPEPPSTPSSLGSHVNDVTLLRSISMIGNRYVPPLQTVEKTHKTTGSSTSPQHLNFVLSQPRPKRCTTHHCIARNIFLHQQCTKINPFLPSAVGSASLCDTKSNNVNRMPSAESMVIEKRSENNSPGANQNAEQEKRWAATSEYSLAAIESSGPGKPMDSTQTKPLVLQRGPHPGSTNLLHGPAFLLPPGQHQASVAPATGQAGNVNSTSNASSSNKSHSSIPGSLGTSSALPAVAGTMSFSYPNLAANDAQYVTIVQNSGYPFPFSTPLGASATIKGASPAHATPILNGSLYSSQMFHPLHHPHSQALVQPSYLNASTSSGSSSSHKQSQGTQVNGNNILTSTAMQPQQSQKQQTSLSHPRKHETGMTGENAISVISGTTYSQKYVLGQNFTIPVQPLNLSFRPSATSDSVGGNSGNFGDKPQQPQPLKRGVERIPSQTFAISFAAFNGTSLPSNLNLSSMSQNPVIFQSLPDIAWQGYQTASTSQTTCQKICSITEGKSGSNSSHQDDEKKATSGKPSTNGPTTLVFGNSSKNLNFVSSPMNGNWPNSSLTSTAATTSLLPPSNVSNSSQPPQLLHLQQQPAMATRYQASSTNAITAAKFVSSTPVFSQTLSSNQASQSKNSGRTPDSQVRNTSIITSNAPTLKTFCQDQGRVLQGHTQISFGGSYISYPPPQRATALQ